MRAYADTSFVVALLAPASGTGEAVDAYRGLGKPPLFFTRFHEAEVMNALRLRAFTEGREGKAAHRAAVRRERTSALSRLKHYHTLGVLRRATVEWDAVLERVMELSEAHTERVGCRTLDVIHVATALLLESEVFLTGDARQARVAKAEGMDVEIVKP
jgi:predicted nucleic acid-binding protein